MGDLLTSLIVPALLIAVNPVPILVAVTLLTSRQGRRSTGVFLATLAAVMLADGIVTLFLIGHGAPGSQHSATVAKAALQTAFGLGFLALAVMQWRVGSPTQGKQPKWMQLMNQAGMGVAVVLGVSLTNYALLTAGTTTILKADVGTGEEIAGMLFFVALALSTVAAPLLLQVVRREWADAQLSRLQGWLMVHNRVLVTAVFTAMGLLFTAQGLDNLLH